MARPQYVGIFPHKFRGDYPNRPSVYKIWAGDYYYVWKGQALHNSMHHVCGDLERAIRCGPKAGHLFSKLATHIIEFNIKQLEVEMVLQSELAAELLIKEADILKESEGDATCLNISFTPHISRWIPTEEVAKYHSHIQNK